MAVKKKVKEVSKVSEKKVVPEGGKKDGQYVSAKEFEAYKKDTSSKLDKMLAILSEGKAEKVEDIDPSKEPATVSTIPSEHEEVFSKYFDREDGFDAEIDVLENTFTIIVPPKHSNAAPAHRDFYKVDKRLIKMDNNNPLGTVEEYCGRVAKNLRYDKNLKTK